MRTYSREDFLAAKAAWADYAPEWGPFRQLAAHRGMLYPPSGSKWDSWEDPQPSQRAIIYRSIEDTPNAVREAIAQSRSWSDVVRKLMADVDRRREDADLEERQAAWDKDDGTSRRGRMERIGEFLQKVTDSR